MAAAVAAAFASAWAPALAADLVIPLAGISSQAAQGSPANVVLSLNATPGATVNLMSWSLDITTAGESWLSEATILIRNSANAGIAFQPGWGDDRSGAGAYSGNGSLVTDGMAFNVLADGKLFIEFYETFDDVSAAADAFYTGTLTLAGVGVVPEPASYALMGLGLLGMAASLRRRRG